MQISKLFLITSRRFDKIVKIDSLNYASVRELELFMLRNVKNPDIDKDRY